MHFLWFFNIFLGLIYIFFGFWIYRYSKNQSKTAFSAIPLTTGLWICSLALLHFSKSLPVTIVAGKAVFIFPLFVSLAFCYLAFSYDKNRDRKTLVYHASTFGPLLILLFLHLFSNLIIKSYNPAGITFQEKAQDGPLVFLQSFFILYMLIYANYVFYRSYRVAEAIEKIKIKYIVYSISLFLVLAIILALLLPLFKIGSFISLAPVTSLVFIGGISVAILKYRLMEIDVIIKRTSIYVVLISLISTLYAFVLLLPRSFMDVSWISQSLYLVIASFIIAFTIQPLRDWLDRVTDKIFFQKKYNYFQLMERISRDLSTVVRLEDMLNMVSTSLLAAMHLDKIGVFILIRGENGMEFQCLKKIGEKSDTIPASINEENPVLSFLASYKKPLITGEFRHLFGYLYTGGKIIDRGKAEIQRNLDEVMHAEVIVPLWLKANLAGFIILGEKKSGDQFTDRDLSFLETISNQMSVVLENTRLYEQMLANERLTILGTMSASIAHEIRNPLAAVKTFVQMLPNKYQQTEFKMRFDEIVPAELDRLTRITEDLLIFSRPSPLAFMPTDINALLDRVLTLMHSQLRKREVEIAADYAVMPYVMADGQQLTQVFMNLILNAIQASGPQKKIFLQTKAGTEADLRYRQQPTIFISLRDEGVGILAKDFNNIFQPFFTTKHEGTGLGLPTCKRIVEAHHGEILVDSEIGKGSTFTVVLPVSQPTSDTVSSYHRN